MDPAVFQSVMDSLWPTAQDADEFPVYALLDGARDPCIAPMIRSSQRQYRCLYSGDLSPALGAAAPYVVYLAREGKFTRELIESGWGRAWGIFVVGTRDCTHEQLRRHFRRYLKVRTEEGRVMMFRFYDPRVLPLYVGACDLVEAERFFGPVTRFVVEDTEGSPLTLRNPTMVARPPVQIGRPKAVLAR